MNTIIIKTIIGTYIGQVKDEMYVLPLSLYYPCVIEFITIPVQGRIAGQQGMATLRSLMAWPEAVIMFKDIGVHALSLVESIDSEFYKLYHKTVNEAWPTIKLHS